MDVIHIEGGRPLHGTVTAAGSKNAALPIMAACIMADAPVLLGGVPNVTDVDTLALVLGHLGVEVKRQSDGRLRVQTVDATPVTAEANLVGRMRASFCVLGPLLAKRRRAVVALPGGCRIGPRPVDLHLRGLAALGAEIRIENGYVVATAKALHGAQIDLEGPHGPTVTGTANVLMAATMARGQTVLRGAACEPELVDLGQFLISLGAKIDGLGTATIQITGVEQLGGAGEQAYRIIPDRIETGTLLAAAAITGGDVSVRECRPEHLAAPLAYLDETGGTIETGPNWLRAVAPQQLRPYHLAALPYPGIPSDLQAQFMALATLAAGNSTIADGVFPARFAHVAELRRFGANIKHHGALAIVHGSASLQGAEVTAADLRASAALVLAGLAAHGHTKIAQAHHLYRGYDGLIEKLQSLGGVLYVSSERLGKYQSSESPPLAGVLSPEALPL